MLKRARAWLERVPCADAHERRVAVTVQLLALLAFAWTSAVAFALAAADPAELATPFGVLDLAAAPLVLAAFALVRRGLSPAATWVLVAGLCAGPALAIAAGGLAYGAALVRVLALPLAVAALVLGRRGLWLVLAVSAAALLAAAARDAGLLGAPPGLAPARPPLGLLPSALLSLAFLAIALDGLGASLHRSLRDLSREVAAAAAAGAARDASLRELERLKGQLEEENLYLREEIGADLGVGGFVGESDALRSVLVRIRQVAPSDTTVLVLGETGVGKELVARAIHDASPRARGPFVRVNCAALPAQVVESELFGHEAGAFTGALRLRKGRFELADGGTLFLDEIGEMPLEVQAKLLRVLQEGELERVGGTRTLRVNVRVVAATNRNVRGEVAAGRFREDLFYRLEVFPIVVPPLRERRDDIPLLVRHFVPQLAARAGRRVREIPGPLVRALVEYDWPGNVRELRNVLERAVLGCVDGTLRLPEPLPDAGARNGAADADETLEALERRHILATLRRTGGRVSGPGGAAAILGLHANTLRSRMKKLGIRVERSAG